MKKIGIILDTNYFLHFQGPGIIPWKNFVGEGEIYLLVTDPLSKELDRQKNNKTGKIKERAEKAIKNFYVWFDTSDEYTLKAGLKVIFLDLFNIEFDKHQLSKKDADDWFLAYALSLMEIGAYQDIYLVTNDFGVHNKARKRNVKTCRLDDVFRLPDPQSEIDKEISALKNKILKFQNRQPILKLSYSDGKEVMGQMIYEILPFSKADEELLEYHLKREYQYALKGKPYKKDVTRIDLVEEVEEVSSDGIQNLRRVIEGVTAFAGYFAPTQDQLKNYDNELDDYFSAKIKYESDKRAFEAMEARSIKLNFIINNEGTAKATEIKLKIHFPVSEKCKLLTLENFEKSRPEEPIPPRYPQNKFYSRSEFLFREQYIPRNYLDLIESSRNASTPEISTKNSFYVDIGIEDLLHTQTEVVEEMVLIFPSVEEAHSFTISYSIICPEILEPADGKLHVKIEKETLLKG